jgi:biotin carboxyl carrier protein
VLIVEALKMQNERCTPHDGAVERITIDAGLALDAGDTSLAVA